MSYSGFCSPHIFNFLNLSRGSPGLGSSVLSGDGAVLSCPISNAFFCLTHVARFLFLWHNHLWLMFACFFPKAGMWASCDHTGMNQDVRMQTPEYLGSFKMQINLPKVFQKTCWMAGRADSQSLRWTLAGSRYDTGLVQWLPLLNPGKCA